VRQSVFARRRLRAAIALAGMLALLALSACSSSSKDDSSKVPFPTVSGSYGTKPKLTFPKEKPSSTLQVKVLSTGTGPVVADKQLLIVDYLGQIWNGKVFDNSYDRKAPFGTPIGANQVIAGWDKGLVGKRVGSRVLLSIPPSDGYGSSGNTGAGIKGTDTLVFVIDLISVYTKSAHGDLAAVKQNVSTTPVTVTGKPGVRPTIKVAKGAAQPTSARALILYKAKAAPVKAGLVVLQYEAVYYTGQFLESTYQTGYPQATLVGISGQSNPFSAIIGAPIGSRVLIVTPVQTSTAKTSVAIVADIIAQPGPAKPKG
jgi:peptidylprolyl isomerase